MSMAGKSTITGNVEAAVFVSIAGRRRGNNQGVWRQQSMSMAGRNKECGGSSL
jgi:hypothetical protein